MNDLKKLLEKVKKIDVKNYEKDEEEIYNELYNSVIDYENETQDFSLDYLIEDVISYDTAEELAKQELKNGGLIRLYYFLGDANFNYNVFRIDGGNLENVYRDDLQYIKDEIIEEIEKKMEDKSNG